MTVGFDIVTGGGGFIGSHLVDRLLAAHRRVKVIDNFSVGNPRNLVQHQGNPDLEVVACDIGEDPIGALFDGAERVFHLAARADIVPSVQNPAVYYRSNVDGTFAVVEAARAAGVKRLVYAASSSCYGIPDSYPTPETAAIRSEYPYALTKYLGEQIVLHWAKVYRLPAVCLRFFNVYGPRTRTSGTYGAVFGVFLAQMLAGKPLTIVGDGTQTRDFTYVSDIVTAVMAAIESEVVGEIYNVGSGNTYSVNRLVELLGAKETVHIPKRPGEPDCTFADVTKIRRELGWQAEVSLETGVKYMLGNLDYWKDAPVWTPDRIAEATADWFRLLSR
ncbi:MAG TPA: NAD-dependent epimerase/dehydratase family protein [Stellaceae bacterium]|jgi:UDP-glucose 4-epimerase|nr:NAD-dependent epimerase/dehydratase family protein [Stellaceae bacterium]